MPDELIVKGEVSKPFPVKPIEASERETRMAECIRLARGALHHGLGIDGKVSAQSAAQAIRFLDDALRRHDEAQDLQRQRTQGDPP